MIRNAYQKSGQSSMEFVVLALCVAAAMIVFYPHIRNHMTGQWHTAGEALSFGAVYQGGGSSCSYDAEAGVWYNSGCFLANNCDNACFSSIPEQNCAACLQSCASGC